MNAIFIEGENLGSVLEGAARNLTTYSTKRERRLEAQRIARILRDLHVIAKIPVVDDVIQEVTGVAYGVRSDGVIGLFVLFEGALKIQGSMPK